MPARLCSQSSPVVPGPSRPIHRRVSDLARTTSARGGRLAHDTITGRRTLTSAPHRILVAEDDPITHRFLTSLFERSGFQVRGAEDGEQAFRMAQQSVPDLVITDVCMPYLDGFQLLTALKNDAELSHVPVIVLSMKDKEEDILHAFAMGADDYVVKPFNARELIARVRRLIRLTHRRGAR